MKPKLHKRERHKRKKELKKNVNSSTITFHEYHHGWINLHTTIPCEICQTKHCDSDFVEIPILGVFIFVKVMNDSDGSRTSIGTCFRYIYSILKQSLSLLII